MLKRARRYGAGAATRGERGFTILQLVVTITIISIVSTFAVLGISSARAATRLSNASRKMASYLERARGDAVRRRAWARLTRMSTNVYRVQLDVDGNGSVDSMDITLEDGVTFDPNTPWTDITFNSHGRISGETFFQLVNESKSSPSKIIVTGSGDVTLNSLVFHDTSIPAVTLNSNVAGDIASEDTMANVNTGWAAPTPDPVPTPFPTPTPVPTPTPTPT
ncbi:MAG TPA: GspH/FimT family pseudopilin, partial [Pyrinomonadaceae bacterium]|nr:GspH/FimT family pseudopilin [Pyrinomonadaceae bacterium]